MPKTNTKIYIKYIKPFKMSIYDMYFRLNLIFLLKSYIFICFFWFLAYTD